MQTEDKFMHFLEIIIGLRVLGTVVQKQLQMNFLSKALA